MGTPMKTIRIAIGEPLLDRLDREVVRAGVARSAFIRAAVEEKLTEIETFRAERGWEESYRAQPADERELEMWRGKQVWGEPWED